MAAKSPSYYKTGACQEVKQKEHLFHLYMQQHTGEGPTKANQVGQGLLAIVDWTVLDGRPPEANIVARAKGTAVPSGQNWVMCYTILFSDERFVINLLYN